MTCCHLGPGQRRYESCPCLEGSRGALCTRQGSWYLRGNNCANPGTEVYVCNYFQDQARKMEEWAGWQLGESVRLSS